MKERVIALFVLAAAVLALASVAVSAPADPSLAQSQGFRKAVTLASVRAHQEALQAIGTANGGNRLASTAGHDQSAEYVFNQLQVAGYTPHYQEFSFLLVSDRTPPVLQRIAPNPRTYTDGPDFQTMQ